MDGGGLVVDGARPSQREEWLRSVYSDDVLVTRVDDTSPEEVPEGAEVEGLPTSSSTTPSLMADMLEALDVHEGCRILEIGNRDGLQRDPLVRASRCPVRDEH